MPGRQAHGRPLLASGPVTKKASRPSKSRRSELVLDPLSVATRQVQAAGGDNRIRGGIEFEGERKHRRQDDDEAEDQAEYDRDTDERRQLGEGGEGAAGGRLARGRAQRKRPKRDGTMAEDVEFGSDSDGNEWRVGGVVDGEDDSEIDSDEAFGESDDEQFSGFAFGGSTGAGLKGRVHHGEGEADANDAEDAESLGEDAIDLAEALDIVSSADEDEHGKEEDECGSGSEESDGLPSSSDDDMESDDASEADADQLKLLKNLASKFAGADDESSDRTGDAGKSSQTKQKLELEDLALSGIKDAQIRQSIKLMTREDTTKRLGAAKKRLNAPLPQRQQDRLGRAAAYDQTKESLDRWEDTVQRQRRAEHVVFPLQQNERTNVINMTEFAPLDLTDPTSELEKTIKSIMEQSGLALTKKSAGRPSPDEAAAAAAVAGELRQLTNERRLQRELNSREAERTKRIKKIKSKAYHRLHRKQREREEQALQEALAAEGGLPSDEEREALDRKRALERAGSRHRESKWAKNGAGIRRAVWDEDYRTGLADMARREEELLRRKEGRGGGQHEPDDVESESESESGGDGFADENARLHRQLDRAAQGPDPIDKARSGLMALKFMRRAEEARKKANDETVKELQKVLASDDDADDRDGEPTEVGRRTYGAITGPAVKTPRPVDKQSEAEAPSLDTVPTSTWTSLDDRNPAAGAWSSGQPRRRPREVEVDLTAAVAVAIQPQQAPPGIRRVGEHRKGEGKGERKVERNGGKKVEGKVEEPVAEEEDERGGSDDADPDQEPDPTVYLPLAVRDQALVARAFAGDDVVGSFERDKAETAVAQDDQYVDETLPGWGGRWAGAGVAERRQQPGKRQFVRRVAEGVKPSDRKDAKLQRVIISEKRCKKNDRYLATDLPHPFEGPQQYERSIRQPVGPEWMTKMSFQDSIKPRLLIKPGVIEPMSKPIV